MARIKKERVKGINNINGLPNIKQLLSEQDRLIEDEFSYYEDEFINSGIPYERHIGKYIKFQYIEDTLENGLFFNSHLNGWMILKVDFTMPIIRIY